MPANGRWDLTRRLKIKHPQNNYLRTCARELFLYHNNQLYGAGSILRS